MYNYIIVFLITLFYIFSNSMCQLYLDDLCIPGGIHSDENGVCMNAKDCWHVRDDLNKGDKPAICSFEGKDSIVCCRQPLDGVNASRISVKISNCGPIPEEASKVKQTGQKAWDKCIENLEYVYPCKNVTTDDSCEEGESCNAMKPTRTYSCAHMKMRLRSSFSMPSLSFGDTENVTEREFPHMALLGYGTFAETVKWSCSGTVVSEYYVLTAGHCSTHRLYGSLSFIRVGLLKPSDPIEPSRLHSVAEIVLHPDSKPNGMFLDNDIALIKTETPIILDERVYPACLQTNNELNEEHMLASGWSLEGGMSERLAKVWLESNPPNMCDHFMSSTALQRNNLVKPSQFCLGYVTQPKDLCEMNAGGPVQILNPDVDCMYTVIGVRSFPRICRAHRLRTSALYTRVSHFIPWIEKVVWS